jgi:hypothetical protein
MALGVALGDAMRDPTGTRVIVDRPEPTEAVNVRMPAPPPAPAPHAYDPLAPEPGYVPEPGDPASWDLDAPLPPPAGALLDDPFPPFSSVAVVRNPTRDELDALPANLGQPKQRSRLDEPFPRSRLDELYPPAL